jgi:hypothetical protein
MDAFKYGLKPVPFRIFLWVRKVISEILSSGLVKRDRLKGFVRRIRPTYAGGEHGAPVQGTRLAVAKSSHRQKKIPLKPLEKRVSV